PQMDARRVARAVFGPFGTYLDGQALDLGRDAQLGVADAECGTPGVVDRARLRAPPADHHDRDERVRHVRLGDRELQRRRARGEAYATLLDDPLALDRDPRLRVGDRRGEEDGGRVADGVTLAVGDHVHLELRVVVPRHPVAPRRPAVEASERGAAL